MNYEPYLYGCIPYSNYFDEIVFVLSRVLVFIIRLIKHVNKRVR